MDETNKEIKVIRYKCIVSYDGTNFHGFQSQIINNETLRTVEDEIEKALNIICKKETKIFASGRTDAHVHAIGQVFHFDSDIDIDVKSMKRAINSLLPSDIYIKNVEKVSEDFHARFSVLKKEYHYLIGLSEYDPLRSNYLYYPLYKDFDIDKMIDASKIFIGEHDFRSFTKNHDAENTIRTIYSIDFEIKHKKDEKSGNEEKDYLEIRIVGNGFLHNMVRILVAMLFMVSINKISKEELKSILGKKNRQFAPKTAPPNGLYLYKVYYEEKK